MAGALRPIGVAGIAALFFVSGWAALAYEVIWTRYLGLMLGHDGYAVVAVLAAYMGGLALGNGLVGPRVDGMQRPLLLFGLLELGAGIYAVAFSASFSALRQAYASVQTPFAAHRSVSFSCG